MRSGARFCASCVITVTCWAVWLVLGATLIGLTYVALAHELPIPGFVLRRVEARLAESGFDLQFGSARVDPNGQLLLQDATLRSRQFSDPLLTCRLLYVRHDFWSLLSGRPAPAEIAVEGAALQLPAMLSPSGTSEPVVRDLTASLRYEDHLWHVDQLTGRVGGLTVTAHGEAALPVAHGPAGGRFPLEELTARYLQTARQLVPVLDRLSAFDDPKLDVHLNHNRVDLRLTAHGVDRPWGQPLTGGPFVAGTSLWLDGSGARPFRVFVFARQVAWRDVTVQRAHVVLRATLNPATFAFKPLGGQLSAGSLEAFGEQLLGPGMTAEVDRWPECEAEAFGQLAGQFLAVGGTANLQEKRADIHAEGRVAPEFIARTLAEHTPRAAAYFEFADPVAFQANVTFEPGWKFGGLRSWVDAARLDSHGVKVTAARGRIDIAGTEFLAHDAYAEIGESQAVGSYWMNFATTDYRMLLDGQLRPEGISGWFRGDWWPAFWQRFFAFPGPPPAADVDIRGRWKEWWLSNNFIRARAAPATVWGGDFEQVSTTLFVRPFFSHAWNIEARRAAGTERVSGWFKRTATAGGRDAGRFEFDFAGNPALPVLGKIVECRADDVLATLAVEHAPELHAWGTIDGAESDYQFTADSHGPLRYFGFPFENIRLNGAMHGPDVRLDRVDFAVAGGTGRVRAELTGSPPDRRVGFDIFVNGARLNRVLAAFEEFQARRTGKTLLTNGESKFVRKAGNSQIDLALSAEGAPGNVASFKGSGNAALTGAELGEVHLFGLLSQALSGLSLNFSSLKLDAVRTSFEIHDGAAFFPDLKVTGPSAVIDGRGKYSFASNALDFNAKFKPYDQPGSLLAAAVGLVMNPLTSILELRLTGPLRDPKWSIDVTAPSSTPKAPAEAKPAGATTPTTPVPPPTAPSPAG